MTLRLTLTLLTAAAALAGSIIPAAQAQASYAGTGPGSYVSLGATFSGYNSGQYGKTLLTGGSGYIDANLYRRIGVEAEYRKLNHGTSEGIRETSYLVGPKISFKPCHFRPYVKLLAGRGDFHFPFGYAQGSYFMFAPGGGVDWRVGHSRLQLRLIDVEYQIWPNFVPFGQLSPYGASAGLSFQLFEPKR